MKVKVAVLQYNCPEYPEESLRKLNEMVGQASFMGAKLVVAPETSVGDAVDTKNSGRDYLQDLIEISLNNKVYLATSYYKKSEKSFKEQGYIVSPEGEIVVSHEKIYLAKPEVDDLGVQPGNKLEVGNSEVGKLGMLMCKDGFNKYSHFLYEKFNTSGAEIICIPSWFIGWKEMDTSTYIKAIFTYGAFTSRSFVLVSGSLNERLDSFGRSLIISPVNGVLREGSPDKKEILMEELELDEVKKAREFDSWWQPKKKVETK